MQVRDNEGQHDSKFLRRVLFSAMPSSGNSVER